MSGGGEIRWSGEGRVSQVAEEEVSVEGIVSVGVTEAVDVLEVGGEASG